MVNYRLTSRQKANTLDMTKVIGQRVVDNAGRLLGFVKEIHVDRSTYAFQGISVHRGHSREDDYYGRDYIARMTQQGVQLSIAPKRTKSPRQAMLKEV